MSRNWRYYLPGYVMALPHTVIGLLLCLVYRAHSWRWSDGCIECIAGDLIWGKPGAQTHGWLIVYRDEKARQRADLRVHERCHVVQGMIGSVGYMAAYGIHFLWNYVRDHEYPDMERQPRWWRAYRGVWFEEQAYELQAGYLFTVQTLGADWARGRWGHLDG